MSNIGVILSLKGALALSASLPGWTLFIFYGVRGILIQEELEKARDRYSEWYDFAPSGYATLSKSIRCRYDGFLTQIR